MSERSTFLRVMIPGVMSLGLLLAVGTFEPATAQSSSAYQYAVKFVCGWLPPVPPQDDQYVKPGDYATSINIFNPTETIRIDGVARPNLFYRNGASLPPPGSPMTVRAFRYRTLHIDCVSIWAAIGLPPGTFVEGVVHLGFPARVQVSAVYTSQTHNDPVLGPDVGAGHSIDVEYIEPFVTPSTP